MHARKAFTLIELAVTICIIALLAAIIVPTVARVRAKVQQSTCASNLRQIGHSIQIYTADYDEVLPGWEQLPGGNGEWQTRLRPYYVDRTGWFKCPVKPAWYGANSAAPGGGIWRSYRDGVLRLSQLPGASTTVSVVDNWQNRDLILSVALEPTTVAPSGRHQNGIPFLFSGTAVADWGVVAWHFDKANVLFADGHVKAMRLEELATRKNGRAVWWTKEED